MAFFNKVRRQEYKWAGELLAEQDFLRLRYAWRRDLRRADLKMLRTLGLPKGTSDLVPEFSSARPGFHDWHLNNDEGLVLAKALEIFDGFLDETKGIDPALIWPSVETCPWLRFGTDGLVRAVQIPLEAAVEEAGWAPPTGWPQPGLKRRGTWEIGCFHPISPVGKPKERKSIMQVSVVVDGENGMALHHSMGLAGELHLKTLWTTMAEAVENLGHLPSRLRVKDEASEAMFRALGFDVERSTEMPAFEEMQETMLGMMGDTRLDALSI